MDTRYTSFKEIRRHIGRIDREMVALLAFRSNLITQAAAFEKTGEEACGATRVEHVIIDICALDGHTNACADGVKQIYLAMIDAFIAQELKTQAALSNEGLSS